MPESADRPQPGSGVYVYDFADGRAGMADLLGKGANLAEMTWLGLPAPPGYTVTTDARRAYLRTGRAPFGLPTASRARWPRWCPRSPGASEKRCSPPHGSSCRRLHARPRPHPHWTRATGPVGEGTKSPEDSTPAAGSWP